jgi:hypothetical protein
VLFSLAPVRCGGQVGAGAGSTSSPLFPRRIEVPSRLRSSRHGPPREAFSPDSRRSGEIGSYSVSCNGCRYFEECSAPICPEDPQKGCAWFPDEEICRRGDHASETMVRAQKRIAKATGKDFERGCFTAAMLSGVTKITKGIRGLDPESEITEVRVKKWLSGFKGQRALSEEQKAVLRARALKMRSGSKGPMLSGATGVRPDEGIGA